jgi:hypothetical protein
MSTVLTVLTQITVSDFTLQRVAQSGQAWQGKYGDSWAIDVNNCHTIASDALRNTPLWLYKHKPCRLRRMYEASINAKPDTITAAPKDENSSKSTSELSSLLSDTLKAVSSPNRISGTIKRGGSSYSFFVFLQVVEPAKPTKYLAKTSTPRSADTITASAECFLLYI